MLKRYTMNQVFNDKEIINRSCIRKWMVLVILLQTVISAIFPISAVQAEDADRCLNGLCLGTGTITNTNAPSGTESAWSGSYMYYGKFDGTHPTKYRVLDSASNNFGVTGGSLFLDCDSILYRAQFKSEGAAALTHDWATSDVKAGINGASFLEKDGNFTKAESAAIAGSTSTAEPGLNGEKIFLLNIADVTNSAYGYSATESYVAAENRKKGSNNPWWLRSPGIDLEEVYIVNWLGGITEQFVNYNGFGVSPAFNVNLSSILFSSEISVNSNEYKLTLKDSNLGISLRTGEKKDNLVTVSYTISGDNAVTTGDTPTKAYVLITDKAYTAVGARILQYSELTAGTESGTGTFNPESSITGTWGTDYHVYLLAVNENGAIETDYASEPVELPNPNVPLTYNANGGTGDDVTEVYMGGSIVTVKNITDTALSYTREGYSLSGWNTQNGGEGTPYTGSGTETFTITETTTLYAQWTANSYNITLPDPFPAGSDSQCTVSAAVNGTTKNAPVTAQIGNSVKLTASCPDGYQFLQDTLSVSPDTISTQIILDTDNTFTMPADDVTVSAWFIKLPAAKDNLAYDGTRKDLIAAGDDNATEYDMEYAIGSALTGQEDHGPAEGAWSTTIPQGKDAGTYYVWYRLTNDFVFQPVAVTIAQKEITVSVADAADVPYDGNEHTGNTVYTFTGVLTDPAHTATITYTPATGTTVGTYTGSYGDDFKVMAGDEDVTANYELISKTAGSLKIIENAHQDEMHFFRLEGELPKTGFSALHPSPLPEMPRNISYKETAWILQIPALDVNAEIKMVPFTDGEYPVDWLGTDVGMLEGSAHPGEGWTVITGHNHLNSMEAGPFALLSNLAVGDKIFVSGKDGSMKSFTVYASEKIDADDAAALERIAKMYENSLTLLTCEDELPEGGYASRRVTAAY